MKDMFTKAANFGGIASDKKLLVNNVVQKAFFGVNEDGTRAASRNI